MTRAVPVWLLLERCVYATRRPWPVCDDEGSSSLTAARACEYGWLARSASV